MADFEKKINEYADWFAKTINQGVKTVVSTADKQSQIVRLRSEIGQTERDVTKAYTKLGEIYFNAKTLGKEPEGIDDVLELIRSKKKLIELLNEKLDTLRTPETKDDTQEDTTSEE